MVVRPRTTAEVSKVLRYCNDNRIGVVPHGGNTGVVGGAVPINDELILSLEGMNHIENNIAGNNTSNSGDDGSYDDGIVTCDAGCTLQSLHDHAQSRGLTFPIDISSKGSCMIGGNISTNAGGSYYHRYGSVSSNLLGLEAVMADGTILDLMSRVPKDGGVNCYNSKDLFVGSEGTLGIVTRAVFQCPPLSKSRKVAFVGCDSFKSVLQILTDAHLILGETLAAVELMDRVVLDLVGEKMDIPIRMVNDLAKEENYEFCILVETLGSNADHDDEKMELFLERILGDGLAMDGILAQDLTQVSVV